MMENNVVNNIDIGKLPDDVQDAILREFSTLSLKHKVIVYAKLVHGHLFKVTANDFFNINKQLPSIVYRTFMKNVKDRIRGTYECN